MPADAAEKLAFAATPTPSTFHRCDSPRACARHVRGVAMIVL
jgi:hypothetical protein